MRVTPTLDPSGERRDRADCGTRAPDRSRDEIDRADRRDHGDFAGRSVRKDGADRAECTGLAERGMSARAASPGSGIDERFAIEATAIGPQSLVPGVAPITERDRLEWRAAAPLGPNKPQRGCDHGLFDLAARDQLDMFRSPQPSPDADHRSAEDGAPAKDIR